MCSAPGSPSGSGKTAYGIQFLHKGIAYGDYCDYCLYINCSQALSRERFNSYFANKQQAPEFLNLYSLQRTGETRSGESIPADNGRTLSGLLKHITGLLSSKGQSTPTRIVVDSLTDIIARFSDNEAQKFVAVFYDFLKARDNAVALFTLTSATSTPKVDIFGSLIDGIIQLRMKDSGEEIQRDAKILSLKSAHNTKVGKT